MLARRELHPDAPCLDELTSDPLRFGTRALDAGSDGAPWRDPDRLWDWLLHGGVRAPAFRLVRDGTTLARSTCCRRAPIGNQQIDDLAEPNRILEQYGAGATVVLQGLQFSDAQLARLSTNLALAIDHPVQVNAYLSPRSARGLDLHFDFHDVVVVQLAGSKRWRVWEPLPRSERPAKRGPVTAQPELDELPAPTADVVVTPGDCVTIPRGHPHAAETVNDESAHLTLGIMALTWNRVLRDRIDAIAAGTALADRVGWGGPGTPDAAIATLRGSLDPDELAHAVATEVWQRQPRTRLRPRRSAPVSLDEPLRITPGPLLWLDPRGPSGSAQTLCLGDRQLQFPREGAPFVAGVLTAANTFTGAGLGGDLDEPSRIVLLDRLVAEGVVARG